MSPTLFLLAATAGAPPAIAHDLKVPPDFTARLYADNAIAPDIYTMTIDDTTPWAAMRPGGPVRAIWK